MSGDHALEDAPPASSDLCRAFQDSTPKILEIFFQQRYLG